MLEKVASMEQVPVQLRGQAFGFLDLIKVVI